jgi:hypothetical protein
MIVDLKSNCPITMFYNYSKESKSIYCISVLAIFITTKAVSFGVFRKLKNTSNISNLMGE